MKLLFDQNLSPALVFRLQDAFPGSKHVQDVGLACAPDVEVWDYAHKNKMTIISKDSDFADYVEMKGYLPKLIWIRKENCSTQVIESILRTYIEDIRIFEQDAERGILVLF